MQLTKHIGCLLALVFATASAFANGDWFNPTLSQDLGEDWSGSKGAAYWTFSEGVGKLNNMSATGDNEYLTYTATSAKSLPGDESTIVTSVKFTAMDKADFFVNDAVPAIPEGAKGGLTIVEDSDANPVTTKFYGIVNGEWVELAGDPTAALEGQVNVEVKIWENNGKHISYKVGEQQLTLNSRANLAANFSGDTISQVSYKGVCEIASLQGDAQDELWTLTLKTIADATAVISGAEVVEGAGTTTQTIKATRENVTVTYTALNDKLFFPTVGGPGQTTISATETVEGDDTETFVEAFDSAVARDAVAEVVGGSKYASIGAAVGAGSAVNVLKDAEESVTIGKALTLTAENDVDISGTFTWATGGVLTIESGAYDCEFVGFTPETLILKGGCYTQRVKDVQPFCATKYFASAIVGTYESSVAVGADVEKSDDMPAITVAQSVASEATQAGKTTSEYLQQETAGSGSIKRWQSYALGLGTVPTVAPEFGVDNDNDAANINLTKNFEVLKSTGVAVTYQVDNGEKTDAVPSLAVAGIEAGVTKKKVKVFTGDVLAGETTIGANKVAAPAAGTRSLVTVPWADSATGTGVTIANLFKTAALKGGEKIELYDQASDTYTEWTFSEGAWSDTTESLANAEAKDPATTVVKKGQALWFTGTKDAVQVGVDSTASSTTPVIAGKWGFVANPVGATEKKLAAIIDPADVPSAQVQLTDNTGKTVIYFNNGEKWGYNTVVNRKRQFTAVNPTIAPGQEFWFDNKGGSPANLAW